MKILFLTNNEITTPLINWLKNQNEELIVYSDKINLTFIKNIMPNIIISYNYKYIIGKDLIRNYSNWIINLHISFLPWNKGADPNVWSFIEDTPKGVTIHLINEGIDTGQILLQKEIKFLNDKETLKSTYNILHNEIQKLFKKNWEQIKKMKISPYVQKDLGTFHLKKEFDKISKNITPNGWNTTIVELKNNYESLSKVNDN